MKKSFNSQKIHYIIKLQKLDKREHLSKWIRVIWKNKHEDLV